MRTTLQIDDDILSAAKHLAGERGVSVGRVVSDLARRGLRPERTYRIEDDLPTFEVREDARLFGPDEVRDALEEP
jgi:hypothetical protein